MKSLLILCCVFLQMTAAVSAVDWSDRKEYDLVLTIRSETTPQKRLALLDSWNKSYPQSTLSQTRQELYLSTYESLGDRTHMFEIAKQMLSSEKNNPVGLYWLTVLAPQQPNPTSETYDVGDRAAHTLLASSADYFAAGKKPASLSDGDWQKQKLNVEVLAQRTEGWANWQRGNLGAAADDLSACLKKDSGNAEISSWLGIVSALDMNKQPQALWHLARATNQSLATPLSEEQRRQVNAILENMYVSFHGSLEGLDQLRKVSAGGVFPPAEFTIDAATVVNARRAEQELSLTNPELAAWLTMRRQLEATDGERYYAADLQGKPLPKLIGTVLRLTPPRAPREISLSMNDSSTADVTLRLTVPLTGIIRPGTKLSFQGIGDSFTKSPFALAITADTAQVVK